VIQEITGLDPVKANVVSSSMAKVDGEQYEASRREKRNIVIKMGLEPDYASTSVQGLRRQLYDYLMPESFVDLRFKDDELGDVLIEGLVESFDSNTFTKDPDATVSILCFDPDFYSPDAIDVNGSTTSGTGTIPIVYNGSVDTGFEFTLNVNRAMSGFSVYASLNGGEDKTMDFTTSLLSGDIVTVGTSIGEKYVRLKRGSADPVSILYAKSPTSDWTRLFPGTNSIRVYDSGAPVPFTIHYTEKFGAL
jgi:hypothetical protein